MSTSLNKLFMDVKRRRSTDTSCSERCQYRACLQKKRGKQLVQKYRPVSLLSSDSSVFKKCLYDPLYLHFSSFLSRHRYGFVRGRIVQTNMLNFLKDLHEALDKNSSDTVVAFYTNFAKAFDRVPEFELQRK